MTESEKTIKLKIRTLTRVGVVTASPMTANRSGSMLGTLSFSCSRVAASTPPFFFCLPLPFLVDRVCRAGETTGLGDMGPTTRIWEAVRYGARGTSTTGLGLPRRPMDIGREAEGPASCFTLTGEMGPTSISSSSSPESTDRLLTNSISSSSLLERSMAFPLAGERLVRLC
jgi:hypothetical protein